MKNAKRWQVWLILLSGVWLFISPWFFTYKLIDNSWNSFLTGILLIVFSVWAMSDGKIWEEYVSLAIGAWVFISPWILGFAGKGLEWNFFIPGGIILLLSLCNAGSGIKIHKHNTFSAF